MSQQPHGILNINKPTGWTSHDVVAKVRGILGTRRVGHAGTLDPLATGVLVVCVGKATRVAEYLMASEKQYRAVIQLGITTDTYDADGRITSQMPVPALSESDLHRALTHFSGEIQQVPPVYSAIKHDGVPLHRRARRGEQVQPSPRTITIHEIALLKWNAPNLTIEVTCGAGTYVRSLSHDLGQILGCGAVLTDLVRTRSGSFRLQDAITLETLANAMEAGRLAGHLHPLKSALTSLTRVPADETTTTRLAHGIAIPCTAPPDNEIGYALGPGGDVVAILTYDAAHDRWQPRKVFVSPR